MSQQDYFIEFARELGALDIINTYAATGNAPTLAEFKAGFPKMEWSFNDVTEAGGE